jgi:hypothetical protein
MWLISFLCFLLALVQCRLCCVFVGARGVVYCATIYHSHCTSTFFRLERHFYAMELVFLISIQLLIFKFIFSYGFSVVYFFYVISVGLIVRTC